jgi:hypothetical protein
MRVLWLLLLLLQTQMIYLEETAAVRKELALRNNLLKGDKRREQGAEPAQDLFDAAYVAAGQHAEAVVIDLMGTRKGQKNKNN